MLWVIRLLSITPAMQTSGASFRFFLAALIAAWAPLWCCCGIGQLAHAGVTSASAANAESTHATDPHHRCHQAKSESSHCHQTQGQSDRGHEPCAPIECNCTHQASGATLTSVGGDYLNFGLFPLIGTFDNPSADVTSGTLGSHSHFDLRNTTGPPVLQGASAQTFFCHFTL